MFGNVLRIALNILTSMMLRILYCWIIVSREWTSNSFLSSSYISERHTLEAMRAYVGHEQTTESRLLENLQFTDDFGAYNVESDDMLAAVMKQGLVSQDIPFIPKIPKKLCAALVHFYHEYSTTQIPKNFVTPSDKSWPKWLRGFELGNGLEKYMSHQNMGPISLGGNIPSFKIVDSNVRSSERLRKKQKYLTYNFTSFAAAIRTYKSLHNGSLVIPKGWVVPSCAPWPESCWNMPLGVCTFY